MSVLMLRNVIWTRFFMKPACWQNSVVIFAKSYLPHMTSFMAEIWSVCRNLSQESKTIEFIINWISIAPDIEFWMDKGQHWQNASFDFEGCDFHALSNATGITSFWLLELTLCTKHRLRVKSANYLQFTPFCIFHLRVPSKHKTKNIKTFYT